MLQIQPQYSNRQEWSALAEREGLWYEPLELSMAPAAEDPALFEACRTWYGESGRVRSLHGAFIDVNPASGDAGFRALSRQRCRESCRLAAGLGAERVVFHSSAFPFLRGAYLTGWAGTCGRFYEELAEEFGLQICVENSQDLDPEPLRALMNATAPERVCVCLDLGHVSYARAELGTWFDRLGDRIGYLHLSDNNGSFDDHLPLGQGTADWAQAHRFWQKLDREMPITLEVGGIPGVEASLAYLREQRYFGMGV